MTTQEKRVISIGLFQNHLESMDFGNMDDYTKEDIITTTVDLSNSNVAWIDKVGFDDLVNILVQIRMKQNYTFWIQMVPLVFMIMVQKKLNGYLQVQ